VSIDRRGGTENQPVHARILHRAQKPLRTDYVVVVVFQRSGDRILDGLQAREMHHGLAAVFDQRAFDGRLVADITLDDNQRLAANPLNPIQRCGIAVAKIIENDDLLTRVQKVNASMRAHISSASGYQDHLASLPEQVIAHGVMPIRAKLLDLSIYPTDAKTREMNIAGHRTGHGLLWSVSFTRHLKHCNQLPRLQLKRAG
jgi:hypothetical protein